MRKKRKNKIRNIHAVFTYLDQATAEEDENWFITSTEAFPYDANASYSYNIKWYTITLKMIL